VIVGIVNARLEATLQLQIEDSSGHLHTIEVVVDTGFTGDLTLRAGEIAALGLPQLGELPTVLADGTVLTTDIHDAILHWDDVPIQVGIQAVETQPLLGTRLLRGHELKAQFVPGGAITIVPFPCVYDDREVQRLADREVQRS
jgi:clan AA aspartic protease